MFLQEITRGSGLWIFFGISGLKFYDSARASLALFRRGSRIHTDRFPKRALKVQAFGGSGGMSQWVIFFDFKLPKVPFLGFLSHSDRIIWPVPSGMKPCNLIYLLWKTWPISIKQWKPVWIRACFCKQIFKTFQSLFNFIQFLFVCLFVLLTRFPKRERKNDVGMLGRAVVTLRTSSKEGRQKFTKCQSEVPVLQIRSAGSASSHKMKRSKQKEKR